MKFTLPIKQWFILCLSKICFYSISPRASGWENVMILWNEIYFSLSIRSLADFRLLVLSISVNGKLFVYAVKKFCTFTEFWLRVLMEKGRFSSTAYIKKNKIHGPEIFWFTSFYTYRSFQQRFPCLWSIQTGIAIFCFLRNDRRAIVFWSIVFSFRKKTRFYLYWIS